MAGTKETAAKGLATRRREYAVVDRIEKRYDGWYVVYRYPWEDDRIEYWGPYSSTKEARQLHALTGKKVLVVRIT